MLNGLGAVVSTNTPTPTSIASSTTSSQPTASTTPASTTPNPSLANPSTPPSSLSVGAKVGIAVGAVALVAILGLMGYMIFRYRKRARHAHTGFQQNPEPLPHTGFQEDPKPLPRMPPNRQMPELPAHNYERKNYIPAHSAFVGPGKKSVAYEMPS